MRPDGELVTLGRNDDNNHVDDVNDCNEDVGIDADDKGAVDDNM